MKQNSGGDPFFQWLLKIYVWLLAKAYGLENLKGEVRVMPNYIVKADNPDVGFNIALGEVTDSEGNVITDAELTVEVTSTDETVIGVAAAADGKSGQIRFGSPGIAALQVQVKDATGVVLGSGGDNFTVTHGDPAAITSVQATFDGLTPVEAGDTGDTGVSDNTGDGTTGDDEGNPEGSGVEEVNG